MKKAIFYFAAFAMFAGSCKSLNNTQKGTAIGTTAGGVAGAVIAGKKNTVLGAIIGAAVGGAAGYVIGNKMDKQAKAIKTAIPDATVQRVGEGINITLNSALLFKINLYDLSDSATASLNKLSGVFKDYPETKILIEGHTDNTGTPEFNEQLSQKRATTVATYLIAKGISTDRLIVKWYGQNEPKYPNDTDANRKLNRRVEIGVYADSTMQKQAQGGQLNN